MTAAPAGANPAVSEDVQRFYAARSFAPAWTMDKEQAAAAMRLLRQAPAHGLPAEVYVSADLPGLLAPDKKSIEESLGHDPGRLAQLDVRVTTALLTLGRDVAVGRLAPASIDARWKNRRSAPDLAGSLAQAAASGPLDSWLDRVRPVHPEYAALQKALADVQTQAGSEVAPADRAQLLAHQPGTLALDARRPRRPARAGQRAGVLHGGRARGPAGAGDEGGRRQARSADADLQRRRWTRWSSARTGTCRTASPRARRRRRPRAIREFLERNHIEILRRDRRRRRRPWTRLGGLGRPGGDQGAGVPPEAGRRTTRSVT